MSDQEQIRRDRRQQLIDQGIDAYPASTNRTHTVSQVMADWKLDQPVTVAGRVRAIRVHGGSAFLDIEDETGKIQIYLEKSTEADYLESMNSLDLGDFIEVTGATYLTKKGQPTVKVSAPIRSLAKALRPLPSDWHGLEDTELRYRYRELDLLSNESSKNTFLTRAKVITSIRSFLDQHGFTEVETPVLQAQAGGATAKPFVTHHNALDVDLFLRVAPELYLKRLIVGGLGRVYEISRCFRNEGIDRDHNPEFTQVELYVSFADYQWMMDFLEEMLVHTTMAVNGAPEFKHQDQTITIQKPFPRVTYHQAILEATKIDIDALSDEGLRTAAQKAGADVPSDMHRAKVIDELFKTFVRPTFMTPTFVYDYPIELSPLAKKKAGNPKYTERFQLLMGGTEVGNAFSELNDPVDQRERFIEQEKLRSRGDDEAQPVDETYIRSLEYGMPPTAGLGVGLDRLTALLTNQRSIKEVILFPTLKPEQS